MVNRKSKLKRYVAEAKKRIENLPPCSNIGTTSKIPKNLERLAGRILTAFVEEKDGNKYIHYCSYHWHPGIIGPIKMEKEGCVFPRKCKHYRRFKQE